MRPDANRVVLVTGASSGIGLAAAREAARRGDHVVLLARGMGPLEDAAEQCRSLGAASARALAVDVLEADAVESAVAQLTSELGRIDVVVHSAGLVAYGRFEEVPTEIFDRVVSTNALGAANVARAVLPDMRRRNAGTLVLVGSLIGQIATPYMSAYAISKWAVRALARQLQIENRDRRGVHICIVSPGGVDTPIYLQGANYLGQVGRPPFPVSSPERVARAALALADRSRPRPRVQVGPANSMIALGFTLFPGIYDALVTPLFTTAATDLRHRVGPGPGNVLRSVAPLNRLHGEQGNPVVGILGNVLAQLRSSVGKKQRTQG